MDKFAIPRVFVPADLAVGNTEELEPASADEGFFVVGPPGRHEDPGFLVPVDRLEEIGVPRQVAEQVAMVVCLRNSRHIMLMRHGLSLWELAVNVGKSLPDTYTFRT